MSLLKDIEPIKTKDFLKEKFKDYYKDAEITLPPRFTSREWGFLSWRGGIMNRHVKFKSSKEISDYLAFCHFLRDKSDQLFTILLRIWNS
jgi:DNA primase catalytic subunit